MAEVGDRVTVHYWPHLATPPPQGGDGGQLSVTGVLTHYRVGWLTVRPDEGEPVTVSFGDKIDRRYWRVYIEKE